LTRRQTTTAIRNTPSSRVSHTSGARANSSPPATANGTAPAANQPINGHRSSRRLNHTRAPLLANCASVSIGTAIRTPNSAVNTGNSNTPPPKPATADTTANTNAPADAAASNPS
jgi:hypothetical protein